MSDYGRSNRPSAAGSKGQQSRPEEVGHVGNSVEADRAWRKNRIANFLRSQRAPLMRKPDEKSESRSVQARASQPGEPAEKEADAIADQVTGQLHGIDKGAAPAVGREQAPAIGAKLVPGTISLSKKDDDASASKSVNLPSWRSAIEAAIMQAYRVAKKVQTQGRQVRVQGTSSDGMLIEMWVDLESKTIKTAYPKGVKK
jgi:hypothetical protein